VVNKAPCRVILTAPPGDATLPHHVIKFAPPPSGDPTRPAAAAAGNGGISDADAAASSPAG